MRTSKTWIRGLVVLALLAVAVTGAVTSGARAKGGGEVDRAFVLKKFRDLRDDLSKLRLETIGIDTRHTVLPTATASALPPCAPTARGL